jgi:hypothetical protein
LFGGAAGASAKKGGKLSRQEDALGTISGERVAAQGCPHCVGREVVGWGRSHGLLQFRCKSCGRTFNALTKTPMAHLRKKEKRLDHARAMIEGKSLAKTAALCGVHPTTAFGRHADPRAGAGAGGRQAQVSVPSGDKVAASDTAANVPGLLNAEQITALPAIGVSLVRVSSASDLALTVPQVAALDVKSRPLDSKRTARRPVGRPPPPPRSRLDSYIGLYLGVVERASGIGRFRRKLRDGVTDRRRLTSPAAEA